MRISSLSLIVLLAIAASLPAIAWAKESPEADQIQVMVGTFIADNGDTTSFRLPDGGSFSAVSQETGELVVFSGRVLKDGQAELSFELYSTADDKIPSATQKLLVDVAEDAIYDTLTSFQVAVSEIVTETHPWRKATDTDNAAPGEGGSCCAFCSNGYVCCYPPPGWCCRISTSCGTGNYCCGW